MNTPVRITSKANPLVKRLCALSPSPRAFLVEGFHMVEEACRFGLLDEVISVKEVTYGKVPVTLVSEDVLRKISSMKNPEGILGVVHLPSLEDILGEKVLVLDRVQDPGNVGTLLRTAISFGYKDIVFMDGTANPLGNKVLSASQGAIFQIRPRFFSSPLEALNFFSSRGYRVIASSLRDALPLKELPRDERPFALILGNEGKGVCGDFLQKADIKVRIEMDAMESLNVAIAGGILMYQL